MRLIEIGNIISRQRDIYGLTQPQLARLAGITHFNLIDIERGTLLDIKFTKLVELLGIVGLGLEAKAASGIENALEMAARTASASYKQILCAEVLADIFTTGNLPPQYRPHMMVLLDETPLPIVLKAITQAAGEIATKQVMIHMARWAEEFGCSRKVW